jgi:hypothetical protein
VCDESTVLRAVCIKEIGLGCKHALPGTSAWRLPCALSALLVFLCTALCVCWERLWYCSVNSDSHLVGRRVMGLKLQSGNTICT